MLIAAGAAFAVFSSDELIMGGLSLELLSAGLPVPGGLLPDFAAVRLGTGLS